MLIIEKLNKSIVYDNLLLFNLIKTLYMIFYTEPIGIVRHPKAQYLVKVQSI